MYSIKWQICVMFIMASSSFRVRQMLLGGYLLDGSATWQLVELLVVAFVGVAWTHHRLVPVAIYSILVTMSISATAVYLSMHGVDALDYYGTYRTKYLLEATTRWPMDRIVQAETCIDVLVSTIVIRALEEVEAELLGELRIDLDTDE